VPDFSNPVLTTDCCPKQKQRIDDVINTAPFVFEGRMIKEMSGGTYAWYYLFEIEKVYRGGERLQAGTVEIIVKLPMIIAEDKHWPVDFYHGWHILFAKEIEGTGAFDANNSIKLELLDDKYYTASRFRPSRGKGVSLYYTGFDMNFREQEDVRDFIATYGLTPTDVPKVVDTLKTSSHREIKEAKEKAIRDAKAKENAVPYVSPEKMDSIVREIKRKHGYDLDTIPNKTKGKTQKSGSEILYMTLDSIKNTIVSNNKFLEFDIIAKAEYPNIYKENNFI
jgi:hypothetical protein